MKATIERKLLETRLNQLRNVVGKNVSTTVPIIGCVRLEAFKEGIVVIRSTNLEQHAAFTLPALVEAEGTLLLSCERLHDIVAAAVSEQLRIEQHGEVNARLVANGSKFQLFGMAPDEYPDWGAAVGEHRVTVKADSLAQALRFAEIARAKGEKGGGGVLEGVEFLLAGQEVRLQTTDRHRLMRVQVPLESQVPAAVTLIVPGEGVKTMASLLRGEKEVSLAWGEESRMVELMTPSGTWRCRLLDGAFPNVEQVLQSQQARAIHQLGFDVKALLGALRQANSVTVKGTPAVDFMFDANPELGSRLKVVDTETGEAEIKLAVEWKKEEVMAVRLNGRYVVEYLDKVESGSVIMKFGTDTDPVRFGGDGLTPLYVVMPLRR